MLRVDLALRGFVRNHAGETPNTFGGDPMNRLNFERAAVLGLTLGLMAACTSGSSRGSSSSTAGSSTTSVVRAPAPASQWQKVAPAAVGLDAKKLDEIAANAKNGKSNCLVVIREASIAGEWYFRGSGVDSTQDIFSATKSITSVLVGIAQDDGDLGVDDPASKWITEWQGTRRRPR